ncbi:MAG: YdcF family protein [Pseudomonadota bacterium]
MIWRRWLLWGILTTLPLGVALSLAGRFVSGPEDAPARADLIVALGGDGGNRVREVLRLYATNHAPRILLTGIESGDPLTRPAYLEWRAKFLATQGVPASALLFDTRSGNTWEEAGNTLALMQQHGWHRVLVVSDPPHLRRLSWVWGEVFAHSGLEFRLVPSPMPGWEAGAWWRNEKSAQFVLMELIKLTYYLAKY